MGLIDEIRKRRDSWTARLEEHRKEPEDNDARNPDGTVNTDDLIQKNRSQVGNFLNKEEL